jgi:hypothetical protein
LASLFSVTHSRSTVATVSYPFSIENTRFGRFFLLSEPTEAGVSRFWKAIKGLVDCEHQQNRPSLSNRARLSLQAPLRSRHPTRRHRRLTRTRRDRSRYPGQISRPM